MGKNIRSTSSAIQSQTVNNNTAILSAKNNMIQQQKGVKHRLRYQKLFYPALRCPGDRKAAPGSYWTSGANVWNVWAAFHCRPRTSDPRISISSLFYKPSVPASSFCVCRQPAAASRAPYASVPPLRRSSSFLENISPHLYRKLISVSYSTKLLTHSGFKANISCNWVRIFAFLQGGNK